MKKGIERNEKGFASFTLVAGAHDHIQTKVWVNDALIQKGETILSHNPETGKWDLPMVGEEISFPVCGAMVMPTEKGALVMRPFDGGNVYLVEVESGYRGSASIEVKGIDGPGGSNAAVMASGKSYHSPQGNLGETAWALVNADGPVVVTGRRTGRRIDKERVAFTLHGDGRVENEEEEGLDAALSA